MAMCRLAQTTALGLLSARQIRNVILEKTKTTAQVSSPQPLCVARIQVHVNLPPSKIVRDIIAPLAPLLNAMPREWATAQHPGCAAGGGARGRMAAGWPPCEAGCSRRCPSSFRCFSCVPGIFPAGPPKDYQWAIHSELPSHPSCLEHPWQPHTDSGCSLLCIVRSRPNLACSEVNVVPIAKLLLHCRPSLQCLKHRAVQALRIPFE
jgi:hypothetical protein